MDKLWQKYEQLDDRRQSLAAAGAAVLCTLILLGGFLVATPARSVAAYCRVYKEELIRLAQLPDGAYGSGVFHDSKSAAALAESFDRLSSVAPDGVQPDVQALASIYRTMDRDPARAMLASLSGVSVEQHAKDWTEHNCVVR